jgi:hypothetical protein
VRLRATRAAWLRRSCTRRSPRYSPRVITLGLAVALALAVPSPVPAARQLAHTSGPLVLRAGLDARSAVVAFGGAKPAAVVVEYRGGRWREIPQGSVHVKPLNPRPGSVRSAGTVRLAASFSAPTRILSAGLWLDTRSLSAAPKGTTTKFIARADPRAVTSGRHYAVAFAGAPGSAAAKIWSFRVR